MNEKEDRSTDFYPFSLLCTLTLSFYMALQKPCLPHEVCPGLTTGAKKGTADCGLDIACKTRCEQVMSSSLSIGCFS